MTKVRGRGEARAGFFVSRKLTRLSTRSGDSAPLRRLPCCLLVSHRQDSPVHWAEAPVTAQLTRRSRRLSSTARVVVPCCKAACRQHRTPNEISHTSRARLALPSWTRTLMPPSFLKACRVHGRQTTKQQKRLKETKAPARALQRSPERSPLFKKTLRKKEPPSKKGSPFRRSLPFKKGAPFQKGAPLSKKEPPQRKSPLGGRCTSSWARASAGHQALRVRGFPRAF